MPDWVQIRAEFPVLDEVVYLNTGTYGPVPRCSAEAAATVMTTELGGGRSCERYYELIDTVRASTLALLAELLGVAPTDLTLTCSTTSGCHVVLSGLGLRPGDEIVTTDQEHHSLITSLRATPATLVTVDITDADDDDAVQKLADAVTERTRLIALSHVTWTDGRILPVNRIASLGPPLLVDGAQSVGAIPVDVRQMACDFLVFSGQKWLLGPEATGGLYVRPDWQPRLRVALPSSYGHEPFAGKPIDTPLPGTARFTPTPIAIPMLAAFNAALELAAGLGPERFLRANRLAREFHRVLATHFEMVRPLESTMESTIVAFDPGCDAQKLCQFLDRSARILVRTVPPKNWLRCCVGFWNDENDLQRLVSAIRDAELCKK